MYYRYGHGVEINIDTALEWFTKSAEKGDADAQNEAGVSTTTRDDTKRRSSGSRNRPLKATLTPIQPRGVLRDGKGVKKDIPEALKLYAKAAEKGDAEAKENLRRLVDAMP